MSRWLSVFLLSMALLGFGLALQAPGMPVAAAAHDTTVASVAAEDYHAGVAALALPASAGDGTEPQDHRTPLHAEPDTAVDVTLLFEFARSPGSLMTVAATPRRFGWTPVATPFIEGLQRPPRRVLLRA